jgi:hypothetical protein
MPAVPRPQDQPGNLPDRQNQANQDQQSVPRQHGHVPDVSELRGAGGEEPNLKIPLNQIICGDALEVMKEWPDGCIDLVLTDPPYGIGEANGKNHSRGCYTGFAGRKTFVESKKYPVSLWDNSKVPPHYFTEIRRI